jgi:tetratricopeptide (TPR) repeat protein
VAQADVLVALSSFSEAAGDKDQTLAMLGRALTLARQSKSLYIQARVLGELGRVQLAKGNTAASRSSLQEALQLDRLNEYDLEAGHRVYFSHVHLAESNTHYEEVIPELRENLEFAIQKESTIAILQAGLTLEAVS